MGKELPPGETFTPVTAKKVDNLLLSSGTEQFHLLVENTQEGVVGTGPDGRIKFCNRQLASLLGYAPEELQGRQMAELVSPAGQEVFSALSNKFKQGERLQYEQTFLHRNGRTVITQVSAAPVLAKDQTYLGTLGLVTDITTHRKMEQAMQKLNYELAGLTGEAFFRGVANYLTELLDTAYAIIGEWHHGDPELVQTVAVSCAGQSRPDFAFELAGTPCEKVLGREPRLFPDAVQSEFPNDSLLKEMNIASYAGVPVFGKMKEPLGLLIILDTKPMTGTGLIRPLLELFAIRIAAELERRQTDQAMIENQRFINTVLAASPDLVYIYDLLRRQFIYCNQNVVNSLQCSMDEILQPGSRLLLRMMHPADRVRLKSLVTRWETAADGEFLLTELRLAGKNGHWHWFHLSETVFRRTPGGQAWQIIGTAHDITGVKKNEEALRISEERFRNLVELLPQAVFEIDKDQRVRYTNRQGLDTFGYSVADLEKGLCALDMLAPGERRQAAENLRLNMAGLRSGPAHYQGLRKDGRTFPVIINANPILEEGRPAGLRGIIMDLSAIWETEEALRKSQASLQAFINALPDSAFILDPGKKILLHNHAFASRAGRPAGDLREQCLPEILPPAASNLFLRGFQCCLESGQPACLEEEAGGKRYTVHLFPSRGPDGKIVSVAFVSIDMTRQREAEAALKQKEDMLKSIVRASPVGICLTKQRMFQWVNHRFAQLTGYPEADLVGKDSRLLYPSREEYERTGQELYQDVHNRSFGMIETTWQHRDGRVLHVLLNATYLDAADPDAGIISTAWDLTEQKRVEAERAALAERVRQLQKMEAIGQLAGGISHDFNNLLTPILGYTELIMLETHQEDQRYTQLTEMMKAAQRAQALTRQLLTFSRQQHMDFHPLSLNDLVENFRRILERTIREDIELVVELSPELWSIRGDISQLELMVMNLAVNAQDAMHHGGRLVISTRNTELDDAFIARHPVMQKGSYVELSVNDTGTGMSEEVQQHLFEPFFTTKPQGKGTGLGLATVYGIVKQHNGYIWVQSEPGHGSIFQLYFPRDPAAREPAPAMKQTPARVPGTGTILVMEDNPMVREMVCNILEIAGYQVIAPLDLAECLSVFRKEGQEVSLLLSDVIMPEISGPALYRKLLAEHPGLKVMYMSGYAGDIIARHGILSSDIPFIQKPFSTAALTTRVREVLETDSRPGRPAGTSGS